MAGDGRLKFLEDKWDEAVAAKLDAPELLRYRSNLLGSDLRITNFGGGNTSSKLDEIDPVDGETDKGAVGEGLGRRSRQHQARRLRHALSRPAARAGEAVQGSGRRGRHGGAVSRWSPSTTIPTAASIDTPLHGFLPFAHVDHLHPDWGIALAASANGKQKMDEFNKEFGHKLAWLPWQRPGFELGMMLRKIVQETPGCDGVVLGGHGLFTWGDTQREALPEHRSRSSTSSASSSSATPRRRHTAVSAARRCNPHADRGKVAAEAMPHLRGAVSRKQRWIGSFSDSDAVLDFVNSKHAEQARASGNELPRPLHPHQDPPDVPQVGSVERSEGIPALIETALETYRAEYAEYYTKHALPDSPKQRDASPTVVLAARRRHVHLRQE